MPGIYPDIEPHAFAEQMIQTLQQRFGLAEPVSTPILHLLKAPGKALRPQLAFAVADACGHEAGSNMFAVAAAAELLHLAALVHDDLVDDATVRRGKQSLHQRFDGKTAVLVGDYLIGAAHNLLAEDASEATLRRLGSTMRVLAEAELCELLTRGQPLDGETARRIALGKAGALFAWVATATAIECREWAGENAWETWGLQLGLLYQLADDLGDHLDIDEGKDTGRDAATDTPTLLSALLREANPLERVHQEVRQLATMVRRPPASGVKLDAFIELVADRAETRVALLSQQKARA